MNLNLDIFLARFTNGKCSGEELRGKSRYTTEFQMQTSPPAPPPPPPTCSVQPTVVWPRPHKPGQVWFLFSCRTGALSALAFSYGFLEVCHLHLNSETQREEQNFFFLCYTLLKHIWANFHKKNCDLFFLVHTKAPDWPGDYFHKSPCSGVETQAFVDGNRPCGLFWRRSRASTPFTTKLSAGP